MVHEAIGICNRTGTYVLPTKVKGYSAYCPELDEDLYDFEWDTLYYFEDWVSDMLNSSDYSEFELMCFEEHYQNLLTFEENTEIFINNLKIN